MRAASSPRQMERENEMIVISHRLPVWSGLHETPFFRGAGSRVLPACRSSHSLCLAANEKDFSLSLEMTNSCEAAFSYRHPERSRGIFYGVAVFCTYEVMIKSCGCFGCSSSDALRLIVVQGRFLATLEMTIWGRRPCEGSAFLHDCCVAP